MKIAYLVILLLVLPMAAWGQCASGVPCGPENPDPGGGGSGGGSCYVCEPSSYGSTQMRCTPLFSFGGFFVAGTTGCVAHNSPVGPGTCETSGASCYGWYVSKERNRREQICLFLPAITEAM